MTLDQTRQKVGLFIHGMPVAMTLTAPVRRLVPSHIPYTDVGTCRWCESRIQSNNKKGTVRARWHPKCYNAYQVAKGILNREYYRRTAENDCCHSCGATPTDEDGGLHLDHIVSLALAFYIGDPSTICESFGMENLQLLCQLCHRIKTNRDMAEIAMARRMYKDSR